MEWEDEGRAGNSVGIHLAIVRWMYRMARGKKKKRKTKRDGLCGLDELVAFLLKSFANDQFGRSRLVDDILHFW